MRTNEENDSPATKARKAKSAEYAKRFYRGMSNADFSKSDPNFLKGCENAGIPVTTRQASKFRNKSGAAYKARND